MILATCRPTRRKGVHMKVFTNINFATGKAHAEIKESRIVGLAVADGNVMQAVADTVPIGVSHNYAADAGCPVTVIPLGGGFARVKSGEDFTLVDLGVMVGPDANGCAVSGATYSVGMLAGLSADVEGAATSVAGDDVVVLLCGCGSDGDGAGFGSMIVVVEHGDNGGAPRPAGAAAVYWKGEVEPENAVDGDLWVGGGEDDGAED